ncbi:proteasome subunit beta [Salarchaeum sp. JOR-1]|uniref:proteasome subunit beta n=1 Tax=Salarchaeum sp. JOR-1 TaxID=2599399 RepID=UPI0011984CE1|nr:proteasome subunit beta [Salarchaeum sp. JOR-1]QDX40604.1 proteasome subunit beta [Salarchaeum sp. JOR-1]
METPQEPDPVGRRALHESNPGLVSPGSGDGAETGTTVVGVAAGESVVLAADRRASIGGRVVTNKHVRKVEPVHPTAAAALSGTVGHLQQFVRLLRAETRLYADRRDTAPSMTALSTLAGNVLRNAGLQVSPLLGGVDDTGGHVFEVDGAGGVLRDTYAAGGSGMQLAYGALEDAYRDDLTTEDARAVAASAVGSASERDTASGNGVTVATVTREGVQVDEYAGAGEVA